MPLALVEPARPRSTIAHDPDARRVVIPARRQWFGLVFLFDAGVDEAEAKQIVNVMLGRCGKGRS